MDEQYSIENKYHIFFVHPSVDGNLGCIHILAVVNDAALNIGVHVAFEISGFFWGDKYPGMELLDCMAD